MRTETIDYSGVERDFANELEGIDEVKLLVKLLDRFTVPAPIGNRNPNWPVVFHVQDEYGGVREKLYLVRETKGSADEEELRGTESMKIACARRAFHTIDAYYDAIASAEQMRRQVLTARR